MQKYGKIDVLINCAATYRDNYIKDKTKEENVEDENVENIFSLYIFKINLRGRHQHGKRDQQNNEHTK